MADYYTKAFLLETEKSVVTDDSQTSDSERSQANGLQRGELRFGEKALIIKDDFRTVTSDLSDDLCFTLAGDPMNRGKLGSIIAPIKTYKPTKMEIWVFRDYASILPHSLFNSDSEDGDLPRATDVDEVVSRPDTDSDNKGSHFMSKLASGSSQANHNVAPQRYRNSMMGDSMPLRGRKSSNIG